MAQDAAVRKRQQISKANSTMFMWVAIASALIGFAGVVSYFMVQKLWYNQTDIGKQEKSIQIIKNNENAASELKRNVRVTNASEILTKLRISEDDEPAQVVLDALPANPNSAALGASLQSDKLLNRSGVTIESMNVTPIQGVEDETSDPAAESASGAAFPKIVFNFTISVPNGQADTLKAVLKGIERSIRAINVTESRIESQGQRISMTITGEAYYEPAADLSLKDEVVK